MTENSSGFRRIALAGQQGFAVYAVEPIKLKYILATHVEQYSSNRDERPAFDLVKFAAWGQIEAWVPTEGGRIIVVGSVDWSSEFVSPKTFDEVVVRVSGHFDGWRAEAVQTGVPRPGELRRLLALIDEVKAELDSRIDPHRISYYAPDGSGPTPLDMDQDEWSRIKLQED